MAKQRVPRRTLKLTRYLESVLVDPKASAATKSVASGRLTDLFLADAAAKARREIAIARAEARVEAAALSQTAPSTPEPVEQPTNAVSDTAHDVKQSVDEYLQRTIAGK